MTKEIIGIGPAGRFSGLIEIYQHETIHNVKGTVNGKLEYHYQTKFEQNILDIINLLERRIQLQLSEMADGQDRTVTETLQARGYK